MHVDAGFYILAAVVCDAGGCDPIREALRELLDEGQRKLHWGQESPERREKIMATVAQVDMAAVVVIGTPLAKKKQERARAMCMETLAMHLDGLGVVQVYLERRTPALDQRDHRLIDSIRGKKLISAGMRIDVQQPSIEPMLWMPDIVAGAVGADKVRGNPVYLNAIRSVVDVYDVPVR
jgi:hypothetical protein